MPNPAGPDYFSHVGEKVKVIIINGNDWNQGYSVRSQLDNRLLSPSGMGWQEIAMDDVTIESRGSNNRLTFFGTLAPLDNEGSVRQRMIREQGGSSLSNTEDQRVVERMCSTNGLFNVLLTSATGLSIPEPTSTMERVRAVSLGRRGQATAPLCGSILTSMCRNLTRQVVDKVEVVRETIRAEVQAEPMDERKLYQLTGLNRRGLLTNAHVGLFLIAKGANTTRFGADQSPAARNSRVKHVDQMFFGPHGDYWGVGVTFTRTNVSQEEREMIQRAQVPDQRTNSRFSGGGESITLTSTSFEEADRRWVAVRAR